MCTYIEERKHCDYLSDNMLTTHDAFGPIVGVFDVDAFTTNVHKCDVCCLVSCSKVSAEWCAMQSF